MLRGDFFMSFITFLNETLLGTLLGPFLLLLGLFFWIYLRGFPLRRPLRTLRLLIKDEGGGGSFRQMTVALAGTLGVGNITGVGVALAVGGAGAVFWMWVGAFATMLLKYAEIALTLATKEGENRGAYPYIEKTLGQRTATLFLLLCLLCSFFMGSLLQGNVIAEALGDCFSLEPRGVGFALFLLTLLLFLGGRRFIERAASIIIPLLTIFYIIFSLRIIFVNITLLPSAFKTIFSSAFSLRSMGGGFLGYGLLSAMRAGISKGLFSHEAGAGTAPLAHGGAEASPAKQGLFGIAEVAIDTLLICTLTALVVLLSFDTLPDLSGTALVSAAFATLYGAAAEPLVTLSIIFFSYATVSCWVYYGGVALSVFTKRRWHHALYALAFCALLPLGTCISPSFAWGLTDALLGVMTLLNGIALLRARRTVRLITEEAGLLQRKE